MHKIEFSDSLSQRDQGRFSCLLSPSKNLRWQTTHLLKPRLKNRLFALLIGYFSSNPPSQGGTKGGFPANFRQAKKLRWQTTHLLKPRLKNRLFALLIGYFTSNPPSQGGTKGGFPAYFRQAKTYAGKPHTYLNRG